MSKRFARCESIGLGHSDDDQLRLLAARVLANDAIEQVVVGPLPFRTLGVGIGEYRFQRDHGAAARHGRRGALNA